MDIYNISVLCNICLEYFTKSIIHFILDTNQMIVQKEAITLYKNRGKDFHPNVTVDYQNLYYYTEKIFNIKTIQKINTLLYDNHAVLNLDTPKEKKIATLILPNTTTSLTINIKFPSRKKIRLLHLQC